jgi:ATP phosphoribosyltransferase regulatory subunit
MTNTDRWLLPDAIEEVLPPLATRIELLRRQSLDYFAGWGYELVMPPQAEFLESLLSGMGNDLDLLTCKVIDQLSGRLLGISPDLTQQVARMDARSMSTTGVARYCYCAPVLHARPSSLLNSRNPLQLGAELYGSDQVAADAEIICLMVGLAQDLGLTDLTLDIGHVGLYHALVGQLDLTAEQRSELFSLMRQRALPELQAWLHQHIEDDAHRSLLLAMPSWSGGPELLTELAAKVAATPLAQPLQDLQRLLKQLQHDLPTVVFHVDLAELRDYNYHTGLVFSLFHRDHGQAIAKGGRYDETGAVYGRARAATGFSADLKMLAKLLPVEPAEQPRRIFVPVSSDPQLRTTVRQLRAEGEVLVQGLSQDDTLQESEGCSHELVERSGRWHVVTRSV